MGGYREGQGQTFWDQMNFFIPQVPLSLNEFANTCKSLAFFPPGTPYN